MGVSLDSTNTAPWGGHRSTGPMAKANPIRWSTRYQDDETDLVYYGHRYYNPSTGRWPSRDLIDEPGGLNLYAIAGNDAVDEYDRLGLCCSVTSATLQKFRIVATAYSFHWNVTGDVKFANRQDCIAIQWQKGGAWLNGKRLTKAATGGPLDGNWHIDDSPYMGDSESLPNLRRADLVSAQGVDVLVNNGSEIRYLDQPGWGGFKNRDIYSLNINLQIVVYGIGSNPPKVVKKSNILVLRQGGVWPNVRN